MLPAQQQQQTTIAGSFHSSVPSFLEENDNKNDNDTIGSGGDNVIVAGGTTPPLSSSPPSGSSSMMMMMKKKKRYTLTTEQTARVDAIFHKLLWLDMFEACQFMEEYNKRMGLKLTDKQRKQILKVCEDELKREDGQDVGSSNNAQQDDAVQEAANKLVELKLTGFDTKSKIKVIKEVRSIVGLGLKEAKELVESIPKIIQKDLKPEQAQELKTKLEGVGGIVEII